MSNYVLTVDGDTKTLSFFTNGSSVVITNQHPNFKKIHNALKSKELDDEDIKDLLDIGQSIAARLSERVTYENGKLWVDDEEINTGIEDLIFECLANYNDQAVEPLVKFLEKLSNNPSYNSRQSLFRFIQANGITINEDGDLILYKGVYFSNNPYDHYLSAHEGPAIINGLKHYRGQVPQKPGDVIEFPREKVNDDITIACSNGLHAGAWNYANNFGAVVIEVFVDPADVVSVPKDSCDQKVRVCKYIVHKKVDRRRNTSLVFEDWEFENLDDLYD